MGILFLAKAEMVGGVHVNENSIIHEPVINTGQGGQSTFGKGGNVINK